MPTYTVHECTDLPTFRTLIPVLWTANHHPYQPYFSAYNPVFGPTATDREAAIERSCQLYWSNHLACPESHWIYARNEEDGSVTGVTRWDLYEESPFGRFEAKGDGTAQQQSPADIWPEGSVGREFVAVMRRRQYAHRRRWLDRRHAVFHSMGVHPAHRKRGVGALMMAWGMERAAALRLEVFTHATADARWLYEKFGLRVIQKVELDMCVADPSDEWEKLRHELGPLSYWLMWKPVAGTYVEGEALPWERSKEEIEKAQAEHEMSIT